MDLDYSKGLAWVGHPGSLVPFSDFGTAGGQYDLEPQVSTALSGARRVRVPRGRANRSWTFAIPDAHADEMAAVEALMVGTLPPYQLVTAEAQVSNVLTPERSVMTDSSPQLGYAGGWPLAGGGLSPFARMNPSAAFGNIATVRVGPAPVPPSWTGRAVTVSAWVATARAGGAAVAIDWLNAAGVLMIGGVAGNYVTGMDALRRSTATGVPPAGAVACNVRVIYAEVISMPQVTWTDAPTEWDVGAGADRVVLHGLSRAVLDTRGGQALQNVSFTATETTQ